MKPVVHFVQDAAGNLQAFTAVPFMTVEEAREAGAAKIVDPNYIQERIAKASAKLEEGDNNAAG